ncbi:MAG TPA: hypothetical protein DEF51_51935 [Myxococcales bacterium]|nr:hypothetical protein [Myxococcales bacterium]|tara:strand:- start:334 stop:639 length:306 start_codon:yes stop_codon:yes gene_type:complete
MIRAMEIAIEARDEKREEDLGREIDEDEAPAKRRRRRIRCPLCEWEPDGKPYWICELCHAQFDTFETHASCPECPNRWKHTQCIGCNRMSLHEDWYEDAEE